MQNKKLQANLELTNPCLKEYNRSLKCLEQNMKNKDACSIYFNSYKMCRRFWSNVIMERRRQNLMPLLPSVEDREKIKQQYQACY
ncbi:hypothetical protein KM043_016612 [Ampulex compressa]|nr:hypothetical protein KM043_016612 [Ampulex compressa]